MKSEHNDTFIIVQYMDVTRGKIALCEEICGALAYVMFRLFVKVGGGDRDKRALFESQDAMDGWCRSVTLHHGGVGRLLSELVVLKCSPYGPLGDCEVDVLGEIFKQLCITLHDSLDVFDIRLVMEAIRNAISLSSLEFLFSADSNPTSRVGPLLKTQKVKKNTTDTKTQRHTKSRAPRVREPVLVTLNN